MQCNYCPRPIVNSSINILKSNQSTSSDQKAVFKKKFGSQDVFGKPDPKATLSLTSHLWQNVGLGEG